MTLAGFRMDPREECFLGEFGIPIEYRLLDGPSPNAVERRGSAVDGVGLEGLDDLDARAGASSTPSRAAFSLRDIFHVAISSSSIGEIPLQNDTRCRHRQQRKRSTPTTSRVTITESTVLRAMTRVWLVPTPDVSGSEVFVDVEELLLLVGNVGNRVVAVVIAVGKRNVQVQVVRDDAGSASQLEEREVGEVGEEDGPELIEMVMVDFAGESRDELRRDGFRGERMVNGRGEAV